MSILFGHDARRVAGYQPGTWSVLWLICMIILVCGIGCTKRTTGQGYRGAGQDPFISDDVVKVYITMKPEIWNHLQSRADKEEYKQADFWFDGELVPGVAVRSKGSSSLTYVIEDGSSRISLKIDFNLLNDALTFRGLKKLNLNNNYRDPTFMRERLAYELFQDMGVPAPRATHVDLWVNDTHLGLYTQVEQVDRTFLRRQFGHDSGNLYKPIPPGSYLDWTEEDLEKQRAGMDADEADGDPEINIGGGDLREIQRAFSLTVSGENDDTGDPGGTQFDYIDYMKLKTNEKRADHSALLRFIDVLNNEPDETFPREIEKVLDVDEALRFLAVETMLVCLDSYLGRGVNYYLYEIDGRFQLIPWDLNESFGTYKCGLDKDEIIGFYIDEPTCGPVAERPLIDRLLAHEPYRDVYHGYLEEMLAGPFSVGAMNLRIDELSDMIRPYVEADDLRFHSVADFETNLSEDVGRFFGLKSFVADRGESVWQQLEGTLPASNGGLGNEGDPDKA